MRIDQDISIDIFFPGLTSILASFLVTIMVPYLYIDQYNKGTLTLGFVIVSPFLLFSIIMLWLLSLFLFSYNLPQSIILKKKSISIIQPKYWTPWRKKNIKIPLREITKVEHHDRRLLVYLSNSIIHNYHVPNLRKNNLKKIEMVKEFLASKGIPETDHSEVELVNKSNNRRKTEKMKRSKWIIKEFHSGTSTWRYLLVNWRALGLMIVFSSIPFLGFLFFAWYNEMNLSLYDLISTSNFLYGLLGSLIFLSIFSLTIFPMFIWSLNRSKVILTKNEIVVLSKTNPFFPIIENRFPMSSVKEMKSLRDQRKMSNQRKFFKGSWRFPPKYALVLSSIPIDNLFRIDFDCEQVVRRPTDVLMRKKMAVEKIMTNKIVIDLNPNQQKEFRGILTKNISEKGS